MADSSGDLRLPPYFPRVPKECKDVAKVFFDCFTDASTFGPDKAPDVGRKALISCKDQLEPYKSCAEKHLTERQKQLVQAPEVYRNAVAKPQS